MYKRKYNKYGNKKTKIGDITFDSKLEADFYIYLKKLKSSGMIKEIELQKKFLLQESFKLNGKTIRAIYYITDFYITYKENDEIKHMSIDTKGVQTQEFKIKMKLYQYRYRDIPLKLVNRQGGKWVDIQEKQKAKKKEKKSK